MSPLHALVTGGATGIGMGIATAMVEAGYEVTATGLTDEQVAAVAPMEHLTVVKLDVTSAESVAGVLGRFDTLAALINCAGIIFRGGAEFDLANFQKVIDVNLTGTMRMCVGARPLLAEARGAIVNMASMLSFFGGPQIPAYTASKGGVAQLTKALAVAWAAEGIRVNAIAPGWIATELTRGLVEDQARSALFCSGLRCGAGHSAGCGRRGGFSLFRSGTFYHRRYTSRGRGVRRSMSTVDARVPYRHPQPRESYPNWSCPTPSRRMSAYGCRRWKMYGSGRCAYRRAAAIG